MTSNHARSLKFTISKLEFTSKPIQPSSIQIQYDNIKQVLQLPNNQKAHCDLNHSFHFNTVLPLKGLISIYIESKDNFSSRLAFSELDLSLVTLPFFDWVTLQSRSPDCDPSVILLLKISLDAPQNTNVLIKGLPTFDCNSDSPLPDGQPSKLPDNTVPRDLMLLLIKGLQPLVSSLIPKLFPTETPPKSNQNSFHRVNSDDYEQYRSKLYIFGDDGTPRIIEFDFENESFRDLEVPYNLHLLGYSMALGLPNGKVIITGGINKNLNTIVPTAFWYDPITNTARILPNMDQPRYTHSMAFVNKEVYVLGGRYYGKDMQGVLHHCEKFDFETNQWIRIADLNDKRCTASATTYKDHIYIFGGYHGAGRLKSIEKYSPENNKWEVLSLKMPVSVEAGFCQYVGDGMIAYVAGKDENKHNSEVTVYNMETMTSESVGKLTSGRVLPKYAFYKNELYVFGGKSCNWEKTSVLEWKFKFGGDYSHITTSEMKIFCCATTANYFDLDVPANHGSSLYIIGNPEFPFILEYSAAKQSWSQKNPPSNMKLVSEMMNAALPNGYIMIFGGRLESQKSCSKYVYLYDPQRNVVLFASQMPVAKYGSAVVYKDGFVYAFGGKRAKGITSSCCQRYNMRANRWEVLDNMVEDRAEATVQVIEQDIYVFGGVHEGKFLSTIEKYSLKEKAWKLLPFQIPFSSPKMFSISLTSDEILLFGQDVKHQAIFNHKTQRLKPCNLLPEISSFYDCVYTQSSLYILKGEANFIQHISINNGKVDCSWRPLVKYPLITNAVNALKHCSLARSLVVPGQQPLRLFDELALGNNVENSAHMFIFANDKGISKLIHFDLKKVQFQDIPIPEGMDIYQYAAATGLPDSRIILTGGLEINKNSAYVHNSAIEYHPHTNTYKCLNPMHKCRYQHGLVFHQGAIYAIGGIECYNDAQRYLKHCEKFDLDSMCWEEIPCLNVERSNFAVCSLGKYIYVLGGHNNNGLLQDIERYSNENNKWELMGKLKLPCPLEGSVAIPTSYNQISLIGGRTPDCSTNQIIILSPLTGQVEVDVKTLVHHRDMCKAALHGNSVFVIGGSPSTSSETNLLASGTQWKTLSSYEHIINSDLKSAAFAVSKVSLDLTLLAAKYQPVEFSNLYILGTELNPKILRLSLPDLKWEILKVPDKLKLWDYSVATTLPNGKLFVTGGINETLTDIKNTAYIVDFSQPPETACEVLENMIQPRYTHTSCYLNNYVYVMGGRHFGNGQAGVLNKCERFHLPSRKWESIAPLKCKRCTGVATAYMNKVYIFGGYRGDGRIKTIERYNEVINVWEAVPLILMYPIEAEGMIRVSDKEILLLGGKDDFAEQAYVSVYDLERKTAKFEKSMLSKRVLCKVAKYQGEIFVVGGNSGMTCEKARIGEWQWTLFDSYAYLMPSNLSKSACGQGC